jgi:putative SOS response-associated peptidase YedK
MRSLSSVTDRMPAILPIGHWPTWLGDWHAPLSDVKSLLQTFEDDWDMREQEKKSAPSKRPSKKPDDQPPLI